jgi:hypothetical protein
MLDGVPIFQWIAKISVFVRTGGLIGGLIKPNIRNASSWLNLSVFLAHHSDIP